MVLQSEKICCAFVHFIIDFMTLLSETLILSKSLPELVFFITVVYQVMVCAQFWGIWRGDNCIFFFRSIKDVIEISNFRFCESHFNFVAVTCLVKWGGVIAVTFRIHWGQLLQLLITLLCEMLFSGVSTWWKFVLVKLMFFEPWTSSKVEFEFYGNNDKDK